MARPRVFISSTFYDLKQVRSELERFVKEMGYEPILNERGHIAYGKEQPLEDYCYKAVQNVDMLVSIVGGRFGSESVSNKGKSISQIELDTALKLGKQVYIFIEKSVYAEYGTYQANKDSETTKYKHVTDRRVYQYLDEVMALPLNNQIASFELVHEITAYLKEQWGALVQQLLQDSTRRTEISLMAQLDSSLRTVNQLVTYISEASKNKDDAIKSILSISHPVFEQMRTLMKCRYRVFFTNHAEMVTWIEARQFRPVGHDEWESDDYEEWVRHPEESATDKSMFDLLMVSKSLFDEQENLRQITPQQWDKNLVRMEKRKSATPDKEGDDDIPF